MSSKKIGGFSELAFIIAIITCALGVCFATKSGFGVSMVVAPSFVIYNKLVTIWPFVTFGMVEYCFQGLLIVATGLVVRRFKWKYVLSFLTVIIYSAVLDFWRSIFGTEVYTEMPHRIMACAAGIIIVSFAVALYLRTYLPQEGYEVVVSELTNRFGFKMNKVKWIYDLSSLTLAIVLMLCLFGGFSTKMIGIGTVITTIVNAPLITFWGWLLEHKLEFTPRFKRFKASYDKIMD